MKITKVIERLQVIAEHNPDLEVSVFCEDCFREWELEEIIEDTRGNFVGDVIFDTGDQV